MNLKASNIHVSIQMNMNADDWQVKKIPDSVFFCVVFILRTHFLKFASKLTRPMTRTKTVFFLALYDVYYFPLFRSVIPEDDLSDASTKKDEWPLVSHVEEVVLQDTEMCSVSEAVIIAEPTPDEVCFITGH